MAAAVAVHAAVLVIPVPRPVRARRPPTVQFVAPTAAPASPTAAPTAETTAASPTAASPTAETTAETAPAGDRPDLAEAPPAPPRVSAPVAAQPEARPSGATTARPAPAAPEPPAVDVAEPVAPRPGPPPLEPGVQAVATPRAGSSADALPALPGAPPPAAPPPAGFDRDGYAARVRRAIESGRRYPASARRRRWQGVATISVAITPAGQLAGAPAVVRSSGHAILDREAVRMARAAAPFPPHPGPRAVAIHVPVQFSMQ